MKYLFFTIILLNVYSIKSNDELNPIKDQRQEPFYWLYNGKGQLHADTTIRIDDRLLQHQVFRDGLDSMSVYGNQFNVINSLSYPKYMVETGIEGHCIFKVNFKRIENRSLKCYYQVDEVEVTWSSSSVTDTKIIDVWSLELKKVEIWAVIPSDEFYLHIPIKASSCILAIRNIDCEELNVYGIESPQIIKSIEDGFIKLNLRSSNFLSP